jgi:hypothetical protein
VAFTRFLISYVQTVRTRAKRLSVVPDEVLEQYESNGQGRTELPEELKSKIQTIRTRFKSEPEQGALKLLIIIFCWKAFPNPGNSFWIRSAGNSGSAWKRPQVFMIMLWFRFVRFSTNITRRSIRPRKCCGSVPLERVA